MIVKLSMQEMIFYNSLSGGHDPIGIELSFPPLTLRKKYIKKTIKFLQEKGELSYAQPPELLEHAAHKAHLLERYKTCQEHLSIYSTHLGLERSDHGVMIEDRGENFLLRPVHPMSVLIDLFKTYTFFLDQLVRMDDEDQVKYIESLASPVEVCVQHFRERKLLGQHRFRSDDEGILYSYESKCKPQLLTRAKARAIMAELFGFTGRSDE